MDFSVDVGLVSAQLAVPGRTPRLRAFADSVAQEILECHVVVAAVPSSPNDIANLVHDYNCWNALDIERLDRRHEIGLCV